MKRRNLYEILSLSIIILASLFAIVFLTNRMKNEKRLAQINPYALLPNEPYAILKINQVKSFIELIQNSPSYDSTFSSFIPKYLIELMKMNKEKYPYLIAFYPNGVLGLIISDKTIHRDFLHNSTNPIRDKSFNYYPENGGKFVGEFENNGFYIFSSSKKLLEECALSYQRNDSIIPIQQEIALKQCNPKVAMSVIFQTDPLDLYVTITDSTKWDITNEWLSADISIENEKICFFLTLPCQEISDSLYIQMKDTFQTRISHLFPSLEIHTELTMENSNAYLSGCSK